MRQGMTEEMVAALSDFEKGGFTPRETAALRFATLMAGDHHRLDDAFFGELRRHFTEEEQVKLTLLIGLVNAWNRIKIGFRAVHPAEEKKKAA